MPNQRSELFASRYRARQTRATGALHEESSSRCDRSLRSCATSRLRNIAGAGRKCNQRVAGAESVVAIVDTSGRGRQAAPSRPRERDARAPPRGERGPLRGARAPPRGKRVPLRGACVALRGQRVPLRGACVALRGQRFPLRGACVALRGACVLFEGQRFPLRGACVALRGACVALRGQRFPLRGAWVALRGARVPQRGKRVPLLVTRADLDLARPHHEDRVRALGRAVRAESRRCSAHRCSGRGS